MGLEDWCGGDSCGDNNLMLTMTIQEIESIFTPLGFKVDADKNQAIISYSFKQYDYDEEYTHIFIVVNINSTTTAKSIMEHLLRRYYAEGNIDKVIQIKKALNL